MINLDRIYHARGRCASGAQDEHDLNLVNPVYPVKIAELLLLLHTHGFGDQLAGIDPIVRIKRPFYPAFKFQIRFTKNK